MFLFRAKIKVRYTFLIVSSVLVLGLIFKLRLDSSQQRLHKDALLINVANNVRFRQPGSHHKNPFHQEGRELLNNIPRSRNTQYLEYKVVDPVARLQSQVKHNFNEKILSDELDKHKGKHKNYMEAKNLKKQTWVSSIIQKDGIPLNKDFGARSKDKWLASEKVRAGNFQQRNGAFLTRTVTDSVTRLNQDAEHLGGQKDEEQRRTQDGTFLQTTMEQVKENYSKPLHYRENFNEKNEEEIAEVQIYVENRSEEEMRYSEDHVKGDESMEGQEEEENNNGEEEVVYQQENEDQKREQQRNDENLSEDENNPTVTSSNHTANKTIFDSGDGVMVYYRTKDETHPEYYEANKLFFKPNLTDWGSRSGPLPMTPQEAIRRFGGEMPWWEKVEILHYPKIWYLGLNSNKSRFDRSSEDNFGFDDEKGYYNVNLGDHIAYRYEIIKFLGSGTFGLVVLAKDWGAAQSSGNGGFVALKIMHVDEEDSYIMREINMMWYIERNAANHDFFVRMIATFPFRNHMCVLMELLGSSVDRHSLENPIKNITVLRQFASDILHGMYYLHQINVVHGDLKTDNIMYIYGKSNDSSGQLLKIADFGLGCVPSSEDFVCPSYYVQTRYYRAPEVILGLPFNTKADMWSVGVILAEFFLGVPPFFGETETDHFAAIMEVLGLPPTRMIARSSRKKIFTKAICYVTENGFHRKPYRKPLPTMLKNMDPVLFNLIARCLEYDPKLRISAAEALRHPFITGVLPARGLPRPILMKRMAGDV